MVDKTLRDLVIGTILTGGLVGISLGFYDKIRERDALNRAFREEAIRTIEESNPELVYVDYGNGNVDQFWWREDFSYRASESLFAFRERVKKLNPGLEFGRLRIGDNIRIPNLDGHYQYPKLNTDRKHYQ